MSCGVSVVGLLGKFQTRGVSARGIRSIQSTGHGSMHRSQPVHSLSIIVCIRLGAPMMASTGQATMHLVQPMHSASRITATFAASSSPCAGSSGTLASFNSRARRRIVVSPPGGQRLMASPVAIARAYGRQPGCPQRPHCVWGKMLLMRSTRKRCSCLLFLTAVVPRTMKTSRRPRMRLPASIWKMRLSARGSILRPTRRNPIAPYWQSRH